MSLVEMDGNTLTVSRPEDLDWRGLCAELKGGSAPFTFSGGTYPALLLSIVTLPRKASSFSTGEDDLMRLIELPCTISESQERRFLGTYPVISEREGSDARSMTSRRAGGAEAGALPNEEGLFPKPGVEKTAGTGAGATLLRAAQA